MSSDHFRIERVTGTSLVFACKYELGGYNCGQICWYKLGKMDLSLPALNSLATRSAASE